MSTDPTLKAKAAKLLDEIEQPTAEEHFRRGYEQCLADIAELKKGKAASAAPALLSKSTAKPLKRAGSVGSGNFTKAQLAEHLYAEIAAHPKGLRQQAIREQVEAKTGYPVATTSFNRAAWTLIQDGRIEKRAKLFVPRANGAA